MTIDLIQGSDEWLAARCGKVTASRMADLLAKTKTGYGASRANYMAELIAERLTGQPAEKFTSPAMQWGTANESDARSAYEFHADCDVIEVGFVPHPGILMAGASPDGLVAADGLVEIKCPNTATHIDTLLSGVVAGKYITQMQFQMACTGRRWCDFVSFDPRMPADLRLFVRRIERDDAAIADMEAEIVKFLAELDGKVSALRAAKPLARAA
ncbi:MAG: YqaJ viral recombinase family protein [Armatimonadetes bacterium]|nr:YqaJ viral recombinase family protein [Armatimonadota bacterium]